MKKKLVILAGGLMAVALSLVFFTNKPMTEREALILKNVEAIAEIETVGGKNGDSCEQATFTDEAGMTWCENSNGEYEMKPTVRTIIVQCNHIGSPQGWCQTKHVEEYLNCSGIVTHEWELFKESIPC